MKWLPQSMSFHPHNKLYYIKSCSKKQVNSRWQSAEKKTNYAMVFLETLFILYKKLQCPFSGVHTVVFVASDLVSKETPMDNLHGFFRVIFV